MHRLLLIISGLVTSAFVFVAPAAAVDTKKCEYEVRGDELIAACTRAIQVDPKNHSNYWYRALTYHFDKKDYDADFSEAIRLSPESYPYFNHRAMSYYEKRQYDRAIADLNEAIRLNPKYDLAFRYRGLSFKQKGDIGRAIADLRRALEIDPNSSSAREALAEIEKAGKVAQVPATPVAPAPQKKEAVAAPPPPAPPPVASPPPSAPPPVVQKPEPKVAVAPAPPKAVPAAPPPVSAPATPEVRVALVIGNANYRAVGKLQNPSRDAAAIAGALRRVGFKTVQLTSDLSREGMVAALRTFEREAEKADWAVVYFAGHGIEVAGVNYLIPVDAQLKADKDVQDEAVPLDRVLSAIESAKKLKLVILDACRDNPFVASMKRSIASRSIGRGLAQIEPEGGVLVAYAAKHQQVALDGEGGNSPFVTALVKRLDTPGLDISLLFRLVRDDVLAATGRKQEPYVYGSLPGELLSFRPK